MPVGCLPIQYFDQQFKASWLEYLDNNCSVWQKRKILRLCLWHHSKEKCSVEVLQRVQLWWTSHLFIFLLHPQAVHFTSIKCCYVARKLLLIFAGYIHTPTGGNPGDCKEPSGLSCSSTVRANCTCWLHYWQHICERLSNVLLLSVQDCLKENKEYPLVLIRWLRMGTLVLK